MVPLASLATIVKFDKEDEYFLSVEEQDPAREVLIEQFSVGNPVLIDGVEVQPVFDRIDFFGLDIRDFAVRPEPRKVSMSNGRVGLILTYKTKGTPNNISVTWDKFSRAITSVDSVIIAFDQEDRTQFSTYIEDNTFEWQNPGSPPLPDIKKLSFDQSHVGIPLASVICLAISCLLLMGVVLIPSAGRWIGLVAIALIIAGVCAYPYGRVSMHSQQVAFMPEYQQYREFVDDNSDPIFETLHKNLFRAFDYYSEEDIYQALETSIDGPMLRDTYLDIRESLRVQQQGGAVSNIEEVNVVEGEVVEPLPEAPLEGVGFAYRCKWELVGTVEHFAHIHRRTNKYDAIFNVEDRDGVWKITSMNVLDQNQGPVRRSIRKF